MPVTVEEYKQRLAAKLVEGAPTLEIFRKRWITPGDRREMLGRLPDAEPLILLAEDGGNFGSAEKPVAYTVSGRYWVNNHAHVLKPHADVDFDYCLHALRIRPDLGDLVSGSTRAKLNQEIAANILIPLPPVAVQNRIAVILKEQMAAVERARAASEARLDATRALPAAYLRAVFNNPNSGRGGNSVTSSNLEKRLCIRGITQRGPQLLSVWNT
jgi:hypothetical protein